MAEPIIKCENVWKIYQMGEVDVEALRGMNFKAEKGEYVSIMGASGSGKSTALNMIGCLDTPTRGSIYLEGQDISELEESDLAQIRGKKIGFVFQQFNLIQTLTALENVTLPMVFQGSTEAEREKKGAELLEIVGLGDRLDHRPTELSGGQQQRVAIARALSTSPDVILADEPTGNLDSKTGENIMEFFEKLNREEGVTIILVTHDEEDAAHADRIEHLRDGVIIEGGKK